MAFPAAARVSVTGFSSKRFSPPLTETCFQQSPMAPRALPRFFATMGLSDTLPGHAAVMSSRRVLVAFASTPQGLPGSSADLSPRAVPNHPGRPAGCLPVSPAVADFILVGGLVTFVSLSRPNRVHLALRLAGSPPEPHWLHRWHPRSFGYMLNRQFTW